MVGYLVNIWFHKLPHLNMYVLGVFTLPLGLRPDKQKSDNYVCSRVLPHADSRSYRIGFEHRLETWCRINEISDEVE